MDWNKLPEAKITRNKFSKITGSPIHKEEKIACIVKVKEENYVPEYMELRCRLDGYMFTANIDIKSNLQAIEEDRKIEVVEKGSRLSPVSR